MKTFTALFIILIHFHAVYTQVCDPGTYLSGSDCTPCPEGTFQDLSGQTSCNTCPQGSFQDEIGQSECKLCPIGTFSSFMGAEACIPCRENTTTLAAGATSESQCVSTAIPTLTQWGLILLALSFTILGTIIIKHTVFRTT
ncbi:MAG TPA: hypothetical protein PKC30_02360 [Saprospiraceae bacterium]|nr:hypothetical protein [Saprospiraceae bacterium]